MKYRMPKWYYYGISYPFLLAVPVLAALQFFDGFPWGYVALAFSVTGLYFQVKFKHLHQSAPEE